MWEGDLNSPHLEGGGEKERHAELPVIRARGENISQDAWLA